MIFTLTLVVLSQYDFQPPLVYSFVPEAPVSVLVKEESVLLPPVVQSAPIVESIIFPAPPICVGGNCPLPMPTVPIAPPPVTYPQQYYRPRFRVFRR